MYSLHHIFNIYTIQFVLSLQVTEKNSKLNKEKKV